MAVTVNAKTSAAAEHPATLPIAVHRLPPSAAKLPRPEKFTNPFCYEPHPLCIAAADEVRSYISSHTEWRDELRQGKMFGVLVVEPASFIAAFSGTLGGRTRHDYFVPPVFDLMAPGCHFQEEEAAISRINLRVETLQSSLRPSPLRAAMQEELDAFRRLMLQHKKERDALRQTLAAEALAEAEPRLVRQSQYEKAELRRLRQAWEARIAHDEASLCDVRRQIEALKAQRHERSIALQQWLFRQFMFRNAQGEEKSLPELFAPAVPPSGAGECCAPRLLQAAYRAGLRPVCMAEFWVGSSPNGALRLDGHYYPACNGKCRPILRHMLRGLNVEQENQYTTGEARLAQLYIIYSDREMAVVSKPAGLLSVPGKDGQPNVLDAMRQRFPGATGPLIVHRLDMDTSGLMLVALTEEKHRELQRCFLERRIHKTYRAQLEREMPVGEEGDICLPLRPDIDDRPRQMVDEQHGKPALTHYRVTGNKGGHALVELMPITGRTHQLRLHCAHPLGLGNPIVGDRLYGKPAERLMLHAYSITLGQQTFTDTSICEL